MHIIGGIQIFIPFVRKLQTCIQFERKLTKIFRHAAGDIGIIYLPIFLYIRKKRQKISHRGIAAVKMHTLIMGIKYMRQHKLSIKKYLHRPADVIFLP